jgi:hypothetical protein
VFCSQYHTALDEYGEPWKTAASTRCLVIGHYEFHLEYYSDHSWMSNVNGRYIIVKTRGGRKFRSVERDQETIPYPMYAIDFILDEDSDDIAIDLNVCPGVPLEVVNMVGRDVLQQSVADFCRERGLI